MTITKKFIGLFMLLMLAIAFIGCGVQTTTGTPTTAAPTTAAPTTQAPTTVTPTNGGTTATPTTEGPTSNVTTTEEPTTNTAPQFVGLFTKQTVYKGSQTYDILAEIGRAHV
jgi:cytoskeletal protein RodZ